ncbi:hypothetical protein JHN46_36050 [Streptomyces sp. MBT33]|uniref:Secreted protein n=1 Tax=Streptomyces gilvifuscus TaxID=1550617 RepID=A0ABT5FXH1_9ACTN|nr:MULTISPECIES: hypothetical protein [Streptomyces]MBK3646048.1 hypothetical protein [Streptomyces sp. MBT33]MDC2957232.1 hypothetical protein [Streptomyces gilvifuscus]
MEAFVTVLVILAMIALGAFLIHLLDAQHGGRIAAFHYGRSGTPVEGPAAPTPRKVHGKAGTNGADRRRDHRDGGRGRLRPRRHTRNKAM